MEGGDGRLELVAEAVKHACVAGSCRAWARAEPAAKRGLIRAADFHGRAATRLLDELCNREREEAGKLPPARRRQGLGGACT